jgi:type I restriction enzyme, S subunit
MKIETFFEKFEQLADAPNAVVKMRELIRDFAISGRLLPEGGSANNSDQLKWLKQSLGSIASLITKGSTPTSYGHQYESVGIPFVKVENIDNGSIRHSSIEQFISETTHEFLKRSQLEGGEILFSIAGTIGKTCIVKSEDVPANTNQALAIIRGVGASFDTAFLRMQLDSFVANKVKEKARGGAMPNVSLGDLKGLHVVVPPLAEQKRIVAKVDELMALCDRLEAQQQERDTRHASLARASLARFAEAPTPANLNFLFHDSYTIEPADLRKSILTLAVQGKLVPQDPGESAGAEDTLFEEEDSLTATEIPSLPNGWRIAPLGKVAEQIVDCPHSTPKWTEVGKICVRTNQFRPGYLDLSAPRYVSEETFIERTQRIKPQQDDILYSREGGILGVACRVPPNVHLCLGQRMMLIRVRSSIAPQFLELILNSPLITEIARRETTGGAAPRINVSTVKAYPIPVPPIAEQRRIVAKVDQLMALVDQLEAQLTVSRATATSLMNAVVAELTAET